MSLARGTYRALEDIVGPEYISEEPAILDTYAFNWAAEVLPTAVDVRFAPRPEAVVLPGSTEEVQAIVKACNRYKIKFKAFSTGWGAWGSPGSEGIVQLDLRRMNRILEIDERNMYAVLEPYVIGAQLQAELMKRGFNCQITTAGSNVTSLPLAAMSGDGFSSVSTSSHPRNTLGVEWVLPTGEILRLGSLGSGAGWFCGDGPGPSLRGLTRGQRPLLGGLGVFTKAAQKIYHWPGPPIPPAQIEGASPHYTMEPLPLMHSYYLIFPSWKNLAEAAFKIAVSEIPYILAAFPHFQLAEDIAKSKEEVIKLLSEILESSKRGPGLLTITSARSQREFDYQAKVLREIMAETEGECLQLLERDDVQGGVVWRFTRVSTGSRQYMRFTGGFHFLETLTNQTRLPVFRGEVSSKARAMQHLDEEINLDLSVFIENAHIMISGVGCLYDPTEPETVQAAAEAFHAAQRLGLEEYSYIIPATPLEDRAINGPLLNNYHLWQRKIKKAFDPNVASDPRFYIQP